MQPFTTIAAAFHHHHNHHHHYHHHYHHPYHHHYHHRQALRLSAFAATELAAAGYVGTLRLNLVPWMHEHEVLTGVKGMREGDKTRRKKIGEFVAIFLNPSAIKRHQLNKMLVLNH